ncbi:4'-phosphopantetheinyl transferase superfamily protein [Actinoplanes sp. NBRC 103695]|uniref:4'-phosphopantetheinyl transferase family protein n=1 Tax=Actinoplanes sp. NBRC 103695 TaxID=3032202 RepID=UPI0024A1061B|nr:4'-phosphopantetheinyl transferase superfamily protein [Actinoplanes sp. NBRC 103695]GLY98687.1 4'-phosphopantetheinyl transferase [Actinoplanes sp. NBRC 103695]
MIERLLPPAVAVVEAHADLPGEQVFPGEEELVARAVESRRREVVTARRCAREALATFGYAPAPIPRGTRGAPQWPAGVVGSITHCTGYRAAAVAPASELASLGIDAEPHGPLPPDVPEAVTTGDELAMLDDLSNENPSVHWDRVLFSAKESVYKAWFPLTGRWLGFEDAELRFDPAAGTFQAKILIDGARTDEGPPLAELTGRFLVAQGLVATAVTVMS